MFAEAILWLALNVHHEARGEPFECQVAVAEVTERRVQSPFYPDTVKEVVLQPYQFSWTIGKSASDHSDAIKRLTETDYLAALVGYNNVHGGSSYTSTELHYARYEIDNYWTKKMTATYRCGDHIFYDNGGRS